MKLKLNDQNYNATIIRVKNTFPLNKLDKLVGVSVFGYQAIVSKETEIDSLMVFFPAECQLNESFCYENNLFVEPSANKDGTKGYLSDKRRVRAVKFKGNISSGLLLPISSLDYLGDISLKEGDSFNEINGVEICKKYQIKTNKVRNNTNQVARPRPEKILPKLFPEHMDTSHYVRSEHMIEGHEKIIVTQKLHGTSVRLCHQRVYKIPKWVYKFINYPTIFSFLNKYLKKEVYEKIAGSRRVVKYQDLEGQSYYNTDIYNQCLQRFGHAIPKNWILYGELIGYAGESEIQKNYTYDVKPGEFDFYVYRISIINEDGFAVDLSHDLMFEFCNANGLKSVPELWRGTKSNFDYQDFMDQKFHEEGFGGVPLSDPNTVDEGIIVRIDRIIPKLFKAKSPLFYEHETIQLDKGVVSLEDENS